MTHHSPQPPEPERRIGIVGAGFTGTLLAVHLMRRCARPTAIHLIERSPEFGRGLAYSTAHPEHLLNVRAANMSAYPDEPHHFLRWLWARDDPARKSRPIPPSGLAFVSRNLYGDYVQEQLDAARRAAGPHISFEPVSGEVVGIRRGRDRDALRLADGRELEVDATVLCVGNFPPQPPPIATPDFYDTGRYLGNPWDLAALAAIPTDAPVLVIGTGLTMVDVAVTLQDNGHRGPIVAMSRHGMLPRAHRDVRPFPGFLRATSLPDRLVPLLRRVRAEIREGAAKGYDWRSIIDALRPLVQRLWRDLPEADRRRFLRHLRPFWEVHRHRLAPQVARRVEAMRTRGQLSVLAGHLGAVEPDGQTNGPWHKALIQPRGGGDWLAIPVHTVINCSGPTCDFRRIGHPLVRDLLGQELVRPDPLRLGLEVTPAGALVGIDGRVSERLYALGPLTRGTFWEITAVPELRTACADFARTMAEALAAC